MIDQIRGRIARLGALAASEMAGFKAFFRGKFTGALADLLRMSEGKEPPKYRCWRCDAGIPRTADGFHQKRPGIYAICLGRLKQ